MAEPVTLKECPCGLTPLNLVVLGEAEGARPKYAFVAGDCCNEWIIEYRNQYEPIGSPEAIARAIKEWNAATRGALTGEAGGKENG